MIPYTKTVTAKIDSGTAIEYHTRPRLYSLLTFLGMSTERLWKTGEFVITSDRGPHGHIIREANGKCIFVPNMQTRPILEVLTPGEPIDIDNNIPDVPVHRLERPNFD